MYAKLVSTSTLASSLAIRDIIYLCTSESPNVANLVGFSKTDSVVFDETPAGWTYVYSNRDLDTLSNSATPTTGIGDWWAMSAPCLGPTANTLKFAKMTSTLRGNVETGGLYDLAGFCLSGATNISGNTVTNEGFKYQTGTASTLQGGQYCQITLGDQKTYHLVATPRHISLFNTSRTDAIWETSITDLHKFYNMTPMIQVNENLNTPSGGSFVASGNVGSATTTANSASPFTIYINSQNTSARIAQNYNIFNFTNPATSVNFGTLNLGHMAQYTVVGAVNGGNVLCIQPYLMKHAAADKVTTVAENGENRNLISPIFFSGYSVGLPTTYVTGICDIYSARSAAGTTGDTMTINGAIYTYIQSGARAFAVLTS